MPNEPGQGASLEGGGGVAVSLEGTVNDIRALIDEIRHDGLVLGAVPGNVSGLSSSVSVASLVVLVEDGSLPSPPLAVGIGHWRVSWEHSADVPPEKIWIVEQGSVVELTIVSHEWSLVSQASSESSANKEHHPEVSEDATSVERLDGQFTNYGQTKEASQLGSSGVVGPVPVRLLHWSHDHLVSLGVVEPRVQDLQIFLGLVGPAGLPLLDLVGGNAETDQLTILRIVGDLVVNDASLSVIVGILQGVNFNHCHLPARLGFSCQLEHSAYPKSIRME